MTRVTFLTIAVLLLAACSTAPAPTAPLTTPTPGVTVPSCAIGDQLPFVYRPERLKVIQPCVRLLARIEAVRTEADGDVHMFARLNDADAQRYLNAGNEKEKGDLVVEPVCVRTPTQTDAIAPCGRDPNPLRPEQLPKAGDCVWIEGQLVEDTQHFDWREIHPPGRFTPGDGCPPARVLSADDFFDPGD